MQPSPYQQAVIDWAAQHVNPLAEAVALVVEAVAGSGKTTTIVKAAAVIPSSHRAAFVAFNKKIAVELGEKLPAHVEAKTLNALGWAAYRSHYKSAQIDARKTHELIREHLPEYVRKIGAELAKLLGKAKAHIVLPESVRGGSPRGLWHDLIAHYDVSIDTQVCTTDQFIEFAERLLELGLQDRTRLDFDDQLYMPIALELSLPRYDWLIVDEAQDVSHVQREMLVRSLKSDGRLIAVGDTHQAIYGFRGADSAAMQSIRDTFDAESLPLSICYRCPRSVIEIAKQFVPHIEAAENAAEGEVLHPKSWVLGDFIETDMIVCRNTAPLITVAYTCIKEGMPVTVLGRDIGRGLASVVKKVASRRDRDLDSFWLKLADWRTKELKKAGDDDVKVDGIEDRFACLRVIGAQCNTVDELLEEIESMFSDQASGPVLCTVHKAKGLEAPRVFILEPQLMPSKYATQPWQEEQEKNLQYVAVTRALETLVYLPLDTIE